MRFLCYGIILLIVISENVKSEMAKDSEEKKDMKIFLHNFLESEVFEQNRMKELSYLV